MVMIMMVIILMITKMSHVNFVSVILMEPSIVMLQMGYVFARKVLKGCFVTFLAQVNIHSK